MPYLTCVKTFNLTLARQLLLRARARFTPISNTLNRLLLLHKLFISRSGCVRRLAKETSLVARTSYGKKFLRNFMKYNMAGVTLARNRAFVFRKVRAIRKIFLKSNARRLGLFPKRNRLSKRKY